MNRPASSSRPRRWSPQPTASGSVRHVELFAHPRNVLRGRRIAHLNNLDYSWLDEAKKESLEVRRTLNRRCVLNILTRAMARAVASESRATLSLLITYRC